MTKKPSKAKKPKKVRVDQLLVDLGYVTSTKEALPLIMAGKVRVEGRKLTKAGELLSIKTDLIVESEKIWVSRGGAKLASAIDQLGLSAQFRDACVFDVGSSTGGFTQCALRYGAQNVVAIDVGYNQLDWSLRSDARVIPLERTHVRDINLEPLPVADIIVADISFNSLSRLSEDIKRLCRKPATMLLLLVKPQFELPAEEVGEGGIVDSDQNRDKALQLVRSEFENLGFTYLDSVLSEVKGRYGNQEIFLHLRY